jgi:hypothetical protein
MAAVTSEGLAKSFFGNIWPDFRNKAPVDSPVAEAFQGKQTRLQFRWVEVESCLGPSSVGSSVDGPKASPLAVTWPVKMEELALPESASGHLVECMFAIFYAEEIPKPLLQTVPFSSPYSYSAPSSYASTAPVPAPVPVSSRASSSAPYIPTAASTASAAKWIAPKWSLPGFPGFLQKKPEEVQVAALPSPLTKPLTALVVLRGLRMMLGVSVEASLLNFKLRATVLRKLLDVSPSSPCTVKWDDSKIPFLLEALKKASLKSEAFMNWMSRRTMDQGNDSALFRAWLATVSEQTDVAMPLWMSDHEVGSLSAQLDCGV